MLNYKISFSFNWCGFFFKCIEYFVFIVEKNEKNFFLINFHQTNVNFQMALGTIDVYQ
jgi:hypothetical protein